MKVLTLSNCPLIESQGSGYVVLNFCRELQKRGHEVDLFGPESYEVWPGMIKAGGYRRALGMLRLTLRQIAKKSYDIIEFYGGESWLAAATLSRIPNRKFLLVSHSNGLETHFSERLAKYLPSAGMSGSPRKWYQLNQKGLHKKAFTCADSLVTVSSFDRLYALQHNYCEDSKIIAIDNSLPADYLGLPVEFQRVRSVGYCGSWLTLKGTDVMRADITRLLIEFPDLHFTIIGAHSDFRKDDYFPADVCSRINVVPFVESRQRLRELYESLAILIVPSIYESFALVTAEAMACGAAVVASKVGFAFGLKNGQEAIVMEEPRSPYLYEGVKRLLLDEPLRQRIAEAGYRRVQNLRWELAADRLETAYLDWIKEFRQEVSVPA
jgi:glycosyltransferase involved in cell wall biosynthesis